MAAITDRPLLGREAVILVDSTDRSDYIKNFDFDPTPNMDDQNPLDNDGVRKMFPVDRTVTGSIEWFLTEDADTFATAWAYDDDEQRTIEVRVRGTGAGKPKVTMNVILTGAPRTIPGDGHQTLTTPFHANSFTYGTQ